MSSESVSEYIQETGESSRQVPQVSTGAKGVTRASIVQG